MPPPSSHPIFGILVGLCHHLGLEVTAEGIECREQLALLTDLTPIYLQGYLLARPGSAQKLLSVIAGLPNHMASLVLSSSATTITDDALAERCTGGRVFWAANDADYFCSHQRYEL